MSLRVENLEVVYDDIAQVLRGVSVTVETNTIVALLGSNGAGKSTLLRALTGLLPIHDGEITAGRVMLADRDVSGKGAADLVRSGIIQVPEGRRILAELTVEENLKVGAHTRSSRSQDDLDRVYERFPVLAERRGATAGYLSGGEQQMLAMGRGLMADPKYLLLDEPSLGLAPQIVERIRDLIVEINQSGVTVLLVEQNAAMALSIADHGYVMETGRIVMDNPPSQLLKDADIREFYLGRGSEGDGSNLREVKSYKRRKRWLS